MALIIFNEKDLSNEYDSAILVEDELSHILHLIEHSKKYGYGTFIPVVYHCSYFQDGEPVSEQVYINYKHIKMIKP